MSDAPSEPAPSDTKTCPYCAETIKAAAIVCRYCGRDLVPQPASPAKGDLPPRYSDTTTTKPFVAGQPAQSSKYDPPVLKQEPSRVGGCLKTAGIAALVIIGLIVLGNLATGGRGSATVRVVPTQSATPVPTLTAAQLRAKAAVVPFDELARNTERYEGSLIALTGKVAQVLEAGDAAGLRVNIDGDYDKTVYVQYGDYNKRRVLEGDTVEVVARLDGRTTYKTVLGSEVTLPSLTSLLLEVQPKIK